MEERPSRLWTSCAPERSPAVRPSRAALGARERLTDTSDGSHSSAHGWTLWLPSTWAVLRSVSLHTTDDTCLRCSTDSGPPTHPAYACLNRKRLDLAAAAADRLSLHGVEARLTRLTQSPRRSAHPSPPSGSTDLEGRSGHRPILREPLVSGSGEPPGAPAGIEDPPPLGPFGAFRARRDHRIPPTR